MEEIIFNCLHSKSYVGYQVQRYFGWTKPVDIMQKWNNDIELYKDTSAVVKPIGIKSGQTLSWRRYHEYVAVFRYFTMICTRKFQYGSTLSNWFCPRLCMPDLKRRRTILLDAAQVAMMLIKVLFFDAVVSSTPSSSMLLWGMGW